MLKFCPIKSHFLVPKLYNLSENSPVFSAFNAVALLMGMLWVQGCDSSTYSHSRPKGHYEDMKQSEAETVAAKKPLAVPEYAPTETVIISSDLVGDHGYQNTAIPKAIMDAGAKILIMGSQMTSDGLDGTEFVKFLETMAPYKSRMRLITIDLPMFPSTWTRDWAPISAVDQNKNRIILDFNYYPFRPTDDYVPTLIAKSIEKYERLSVPLYLEGGNFLTAGDRVCFTTSRTIESNNEKPKSYIVDAKGIVIGEEGSAPVGPDLKLVKGIGYFDREGNMRVRKDELMLNHAAIVDLLKKSAGCKNVHIFPKMPHESTGHLDMWTKALDEKTMIVGEINRSDAATLADKSLAAASLDLAQYLDERSDQISKFGFHVIRIPMPLPHRLTKKTGPQGGVAFGFRSFTNSLLVVGEKTRTVLVPRYKKVWNLQSSADHKAREEYPDHSRTAEIEAKVASIYQEAGYKVEWIDADEIIAYGGAVHCATMQIPLTK